MRRRAGIDRASTIHAGLMQRWRVVAASLDATGFPPGRIEFAGGTLLIDRTAGSVAAVGEVIDEVGAMLIARSIMSDRHLDLARSAAKEGGCRPFRIANATGQDAAGDEVSFSRMDLCQSLHVGGDDHWIVIRHVV
jgi:hypothetical protein